MNANLVYDWIVRVFFAVAGAILAYIEPLQEVMYVIFASIVLDVVTAYLLNRRVADKYKGVSHGKIQSQRLKNLGKTTIGIFSIILLAHGIDQYCFVMFDLKLPYLVASAFCMIQMVSCLENISSCNDAKWAKLLQKILVDKTARHFDMTASDFIKEVQDIKNEENKVETKNDKKDGKE